MRTLLILCVLLVACAPAIQQPEQPSTEQPIAQTPTENITAHVVAQVPDTTVENPAPEVVAKQTVIVAAGDSLTAGLGVDPSEAYPAQLESLLKADDKDVQVMNAGVSYETSGQLLARVPAIVAMHPDIVIVETGSNDVAQGIPFTDTFGNVDAILTQLQKENITVILAGMEVNATYDGYTVQLQTAYPQIAQDHNVGFIPFFLQGVAGNPDLNLPDMLHPNAAGYRIIAEQNVLPVVEQYIA